MGEELNDVAEFDQERAGAASETMDIADAALKKAGGDPVKAVVLMIFLLAHFPPAEVAAMLANLAVHAAVQRRMRDLEVGGHG
jgi:hypothetical protein